MQVFSLFMKLLKANTKSFFIYIGIFSGLLFGVIIPNQKQTSTTQYVGEKTNFAVFDQDQSAASASITECLEKANRRKELSSLDPDYIQDQLFYREVDAVLVFKPGFEDALKKGSTNQYADIHVIPNTMSSSLFEQEFNGFVNKLSLFLQSGYDMTEALQKTVEVNDKELEVQFLEGNAPVTHDNAHYFYVYLAWIFIAVCIQSVSPVLCIMDQYEVKKRVSVSAYPFSRYHLETLWAMIVTGLGLCLLFQVLAQIILSVNSFGIKGFLWMLNMLSFMVVSMGFTFLVSKLTNNAPIISVISNIISLGMAFTCGVFVPLELLSDSVIRVAHFLPAYWYVQAIDLISSYQPEKLSTIFSYMGIQILFGLAIIAITFLIAKCKNEKA